MITFQRFIEDGEETRISSVLIAWNNGRTAAQFWKDCPKYRWFMEVLPNSLDHIAGSLRYKCLDITVRKHAASVLAKAGLQTEADLLLALPEIVDAETAEAPQRLMGPIHDAKEKAGATELIKNLSNANLLNVEAERLSICRERIPFDMFLEALRKEGVSDE